MMEFVFTVPVLLLIAGTTVDIARYMRYLQITSFVSQEAASQIYRQCSDITVYNKPQWGSLGITPSRDQTIMAIERCIERVQIQSQGMLNASLGRAAMSAQIFRWQIDRNRVTSDCGDLGDPNLQDPVTVISTRGSMTPSVSITAARYPYPNMDSSNYLSRANLIPLAAPSTQTTGTTESPPILSSESQSALTRSQIAYQKNQITLTYPPSSGRPSRTITPREGLCTRGRVATVEVGFVFDPVVKFLPNLITKLETNAINREISVF